MKIHNLNEADASKIEASASPPAPPVEEASGGDERQTLEIALLRARIQHLELVIETARNLLGSNQDRLLRRLYEVPRELASLSGRLQRLDPSATW